MPIFVGGQALIDGTRVKFDANIIKESDNLSQLPRLLKRRK